MPRRVRQPVGRHGDVGGQPAGGGLLVGDPPGQPGPELVQALAGLGRDREHLDTAQALARPAAGAGRRDIAPARPGVEQVGLVQHDSITSACSASGLR